MGMTPCQSYGPGLNVPFEVCGNCGCDRWAHEPGSRGEARHTHAFPKSGRYTCGCSTDDGSGNEPLPDTCPIPGHTGRKM